MLMYCDFDKKMGFELLTYINTRGAPSTAQLDGAPLVNTYLQLSVNS